MALFQQLRHHVERRPRVHEEEFEARTEITI
jgi:hypothetical protein